MSETKNGNGNGDGKGNGNEARRVRRDAEQNALAFSPRWELPGRDNWAAVEEPEYEDRRFELEYEDDGQGAVLDTHEYVMRNMGLPLDTERGP